MEELLDVRGLDRETAYAMLVERTDHVLEGIDDPVAAMATIACLVHHGFQHLWTGFYRVVGPELLRVGPYQGSLGCLEIAFGRGVCGTAAATRQAIIVPDVSVFTGHIACDARSRSEIVVPVLDRRGALLAVFDVDSGETSAFDERDRKGLEQLLGRFAR